MSRTATCACGQLSITLEAEPRRSGICNCLNCQRRTGSTFAALAGFPSPWTVSGRAAERVAAGDGGSRFRYRFCPDCGTPLFHTEEGVEDYVAVSVGGFADPGFPPPQRSVYDSRRHPWVVLPEGCVAFPKDPD